MNVLSAAIEILKKAGSPLHVRDLTRRMVDEGLCKLGGKNPVNSVSARLYSDIRNNGEKSRFVKVRPAVFTLKGPTSKTNDTAVVPPDVKENTKSSPVNESFSFADCARKVLRGTQRQ